MPQPMIHVVVDSREKNPLLFPKTMLWTTKFGRFGDPAVTEEFGIEVHTETLDFADYIVQHQGHIVAVERKGSLAELQQNLFSKDVRRFRRAVKRLKDSTKHPFFLLDIGWRDLAEDRYVEQPSKVRDGFYQFAASEGIPVLWGGNAHSVPDREQLGLQIVTLMWNYVWVSINNPRKENP